MREFEFLPTKRKGQNQQKQQAITSVVLTGRSLYGSTNHQDMRNNILQGLLRLAGDLQSA
jgi:hypothetical protein